MLLVLKNLEIVSILIRHNANIEAVDNQGFTPLHLVYITGLY